MVQWYYPYLQDVLDINSNELCHRRNFQFKKHKTWDGDAILAVNESMDATLYDMDGKMYGYPLLF